MRDPELVEPGADDTPAEAVRRAEIRSWMDLHGAPFGPATGPLRQDDSVEFVASSRAWQETLDADGWGAVTWPEAFGGKNYGPNEYRIFREEQGRYAIPTGAQHTSVAMVGPTIIAHGTPDQHERLIPPIRSGRTLYCQLFSEPDAGSDLASLRTRAERDGDEWLVTGQKVWTSGAQHADKGILLARTDPGSSAQGGITYFAIDMHQPGIEVRPIVQINGGRHFNEVYLDGARVSDADRLGPVGEGWKVARTTLGAERVMIGSIRVDDRVDRLIAASQRAGRNREPVLRQQLAHAWIRAAVLGMTSDRVLGALRHGGQIGPEASILKLSLSTLFGEIGNLAMTVLGPDGLLAGGDGQEPYGGLQAASSPNGPRASEAARNRSSATSSPSACWACRANLARSVKRSTPTPRVRGARRASRCGRRAEGDGQPATCLSIGPHGSTGATYMKASRNSGPAPTVARPAGAPTKGPRHRGI